MSRLTTAVAIMPVSWPITSDSHSNVYLVFMETMKRLSIGRMETVALLMDHAGILELGGRERVIAIYELNDAGQFRQVRVVVEPTLVHGDWNVTMLMQEHGIQGKP